MTITAHMLKINHDRHWFLSSWRYSEGQSLTLMDSLLEMEKTVHVK